MIKFLNGIPVNTPNTGEDSDAWPTTIQEGVKEEGIPNIGIPALRWLG